MTSYIHFIWISRIHILLRLYRGCERLDIILLVSLFAWSNSMDLTDCRLLFAVISRARVKSVVQAVVKVNEKLFGTWTLRQITLRLWCVPFIAASDSRKNGIAAGYWTLGSHYHHFRIERKFYHGELTARDISYTNMIWRYHCRPHLLIFRCLLRQH